MDGTNSQQKKSVLWTLFHRCNLLNMVYLMFPFLKKSLFVKSRVLFVCLFIWKCLNVLESLSLYCTDVFILKLQHFHELVICCHPVSWNSRTLKLQDKDGLKALQHYFVTSIIQCGEVWHLVTLPWFHTQEPLGLNNPRMNLKRK